MLTALVRLSLKATKGTSAFDKKKAVIAKAKLLAKTEFAGNLLEKRPSMWYNRYLTDKPKACQVDE